MLYNAFMHGSMIDTAIINIKAGDGGDGKVSFRREKYIPRGGPDGGDGGKGGSVYFIGNPNMATLLDFRSKTLYKAEDGIPGGKKKMSGANGSDLNIEVPIGTQVYEILDGRSILVADITEEYVPILFARGGRGGKGNDRFKSSVNRTPLQFTHGKPGQAKELRLEIKLIADIGLIGLPNAGKSTLINQITKAQAKTANYAFTTLKPNLGVCTFKDGSTAVIADIPGLIEGASEGKGLGIEFLKHIERTRLLVHIVDPLPEDMDSENIIEYILSSYSIIRKELESYSNKFINKKEIVVINKIDITEIYEKVPELTTEFKKIGIKAHFISAFTGNGVSELIDVLRKELSLIDRVTIEVVELPQVLSISDLPNRRMVFNNESEVDQAPELKVKPKKRK